MNVEIGAEAAQFPEKEYINGIAFAVQYQWRTNAPCANSNHGPNTEKNQGNII